MTVAFEPNTPMAPQVANWTCSACATDWALLAMGVRPTDRALMVLEIGYSENINAVYGLMDGSGLALQEVLQRYGYAVSRVQGAGFDQVAELAHQGPVLMSGATWYHWVATRGYDASTGLLWIANSAPGYMGVSDWLSRADFNRLGHFNIVYPTGSAV